MSRDLILGMDPGKSGAWALYDPATRDLAACEDFPLMGAGNKMLNGTALVDSLSAHPITFGVIEEVGVMPQQGGVSNFNFGRNYGGLLGIVQALRIPYRTVRPAKWKGVMRLSDDKNLSRARATELFPRHAALFKLVKNDGRAEAALLAVHGADLIPQRAAA